MCSLSHSYPRQQFAIWIDFSYLKVFMLGKTLATGNVLTHLMPFCYPFLSSNPDVKMICLLFYANMNLSESRWYWCNTMGVIFFHMTDRWNSILNELNWWTKIFSPHVAHIQKIVGSIGCLCKVECGLWLRKALYPHYETKNCIWTHGFGPIISNSTDGNSIGPLVFSTPGSKNNLTD